MKKLRIRIVHETEKGALLEIVKTRRIVSKGSDLYKVAKALESKAAAIKRSLHRVQQKTATPNAAGENGA